VTGMLKDITIGQYLPGNTVIHRLDARTKILAVVLFLVALLCTQSLASYLAVGLWVLVSLVLARITPSLVWRGLSLLLGIICMMALFGVLLIPGTPWVQMGSFSISYEGLAFGAVAAARFILLILGSSLLTYTTSPLRLLSGIAFFLRPFERLGLPANELALTMTIAIGFLPVMFEEANRIAKAQAARGADFSRGGLIARARALVPLFAPLVINAFNRADELSVVMESRCYSGTLQRTEWRTPKMKPADYIALALTLLLVFGVIALRVLGALGIPGMFW